MRDAPVVDFRWLEGISGIIAGNIDFEVIITETTLGDWGSAKAAIEGASEVLLDADVSL